MPLKGYESLCSERQSVIVSKDQGQKRLHRAKNSEKCKVSQYRIDGNVIQGESIRCDYLVMNDDKADAYLIELKGSDIEHALDQLEETSRRLQKELRSYTVKYRIVASRARTQAINSSKYKKFRRKYAQKGEFICKEGEIEEDI